MDTDGRAAIVAFFDVDNTLIRGASVYYVGRAAFGRGLISWRDVSVFAWHQFRFLAVGENHRHMRSARVRALGLVRGHRHDDLIELAQDVFDRDIASNLLTEVVDRAREHASQGHEVWLVTATPTLIADVIADGIGVTGALGTAVEVSDDGTFTGDIIGELMHGEQKGIAVRKFALERGLDLAECFAYSDSANDLPLLEAVGNPVVVNPDRRLAATAASRGWPVLIAGQQRDGKRSKR